MKNVNMIVRMYCTKELRDMCFSQRCCWRFRSCGMLRRVH